MTRNRGEPRHDSGESSGHAHRGAHFDPHGNPRDLDSYLERLEGEDRAAWQEPDRVVEALAVRPGATVCDVGAGPGYFALRLGRAIGPRGTVYAIDVEPRMIRALESRVKEGGLENVRPILTPRARSPLPPRPCDLILVVNTFHHFPAGATTLRRMARRLSPGGRLVNIDFHKRELPVGPPPEHKVDRDEFLAAAREAGLFLVREHRFLPYQYFLEFSPRPPARRVSATGKGHHRSRLAARARRVHGAGSSPRKRRSTTKG